MIDISKMDISSRDYLSIYEDLKGEVPNLSKDWNTSDENDPGIVLIKLMSMLGDMLSYNHDRAVLEVYPDSVQQRKNAAQIFGLLGYKLHWYQSAKTTVTLVNSTSVSYYVPSMTTFTTADGSLTYTYVGPTVVLPGSNSENGSLSLEVSQGNPRTPSLLTDTTYSDPNSEWWSVYDYNIVKSDVVNNKIYLADTKVDESSIVLIDSDGYEWKQVTRVDAQIDADRYFELDIDNEDRPYIKLPSYWNNFNSVSRFKLFYLVTEGINGSIKENTLTTITSRIYTSDGTVISNRNISLSNLISTIGYDYETPAEARDNSANYINTYDTLITLSDFEKATKRIIGVANCVATDKITDKDPSDMTNTDLKIYVTKDSSVTIEDDLFRANILNSLNENKNLLYNINVIFDGITSYYWTLKANIYLREKVSKTDAQSLLVQIKNAIALKYSIRSIQYNSIIGYLDILETIKDVSDLIYNIDVDGIKYYTDAERTTEVTDTSVITGKINISEEVSYTHVGNYYVTSISLDDTPIKPGTLTINLDDIVTITDDTAGQLICSDGNFVRGTVDYQTGDVSWTLSNNPESGDMSYDVHNPMISYQKNVITLLNYSFDAGDITIASESVSV